MVARARDHPRSRGVYSTPCPPSGGRPGSSPLARGLHATDATVADDAGIIPARAGFTSTPPTAARSWRDHPRSRGVYGPASERRSQPRGSSPLARGLPPSWAAAVSPARDHPRSRGVYGPATQWVAGRPGSSPLARGLLVCVLFVRSFDGIIPARAGFTAAGHRRRCHRRDHPRSRGVYALWRGPAGPHPGSSPLARGLPGGATGCTWAERIIPARAGFTSRFVFRFRVCADHPRSRGVYQSVPCTGLSPGGSSPLARGLRPGPLPRRDCGRIIPARAGFTSPGRRP